MNRFALYTGLALALAAPASAQDVPETHTPETIPETTTPPVTTGTPMSPETPVTPTTAATTTSDEMENAGAVSTGESKTVYQGPKRSARKTPGRVKGDPPMIDHSADTLIVEPTRSTITITPPL